MGRYLQRRYREAGREVVTISRRTGPEADLAWADRDGIAAAVDGAALVVGLAGKSVNCRYTPDNRAEIFRSRLETTRALAEAIAAAASPPPLWVNASTATIYRHAMDRPMTEADGELGQGFSVEVARAWERELFSPQLPRTRRVAFRSAIVLGPGGVLGPLRSLARVGLGGAQHDGWWPAGSGRHGARPGSRHGTQKFSWIHIDDAARAIDFLAEHPEVSGPVNVAAPNPEDNARLMRTIRRIVGMPFGPPLPRWALEIGAWAMRTETELILKSRWVLPQVLTEAGFTFRHPDLEPALRDALG
ncbi:TIGR01777 family protein [Pseudoclavibacter endophyticus]|uniref:TIGR01777 family protein n=2 Tax=Pseudoclavibacter endophyticus TaxID=1778590 RepID=A0A6H9WR26_9MICO|nr:TIGR01777 family protein [Pseudoclavibacter endophyticus]